MTDQEHMDAKIQLEMLSILRAPFAVNQISKLPKPSKKETEDLKANYKCGTRCLQCGGWHQPSVVHLDYVGHAALTDRLLDADPAWNWEPVAVGPNGSPLLDADGGMWIRLTVQGVTRLGYGDAQGKTGANATKERIGDALRNAAMRFGAALDLWHKGDLHLEEEAEAAPKPVPPANHKDTLAEAEPLEEWTMESRETFEDLLGQGLDLCKEVGLTDAQCVTWEQRYRSQKGDGGRDNSPSKIFFRVGESIMKMEQKIMQAKPTVTTGDSDESIVSANWFLLKGHWADEKMSQPHITNKVKKLLGEWTDGKESGSTEWLGAILRGQNELLKEYDHANL